MTEKFIRAKQFVPNIHIIWCNSYGHILPDQSQPEGDYEDNVSNQEIMEQVREYRNNLLTSSDWTQLPDVNLTPEQINAWRQYRQSLRDFPDSIDVDNWTGPYWPIPPM
jgi:hypothetical protein